MRSHYNYRILSVSIVCEHFKFSVSSSSVIVFVRKPVVGKGDQTSCENLQNFHVQQVVRAHTAVENCSTFFHPQTNRSVVVVLIVGNLRCFNTTRDNIDHNIGKNTIGASLLHNLVVYNTVAKTFSYQIFQE